MDIAVKAWAGHRLPDLPYTLGSLEPHIDARTMMLHHDKHHAAYVDALNTALADRPELQHRDAAWLLLNLKAVPVAIRATVRNNAGGHLNHSMFWRAMSPNPRAFAPGTLADAVERDFGGFDRLLARFAAAGRALFGSGWVWLVRSRGDGDRLRICTTSGHGNPLTAGRYPILMNDVWEHAYYLKHGNRRDRYLDEWWAVVDWAEAERRFDRSDRVALGDWEDEGGQ